MKTKPTCLKSDDNPDGCWIWGEGDYDCAAYAYHTWKLDYKSKRFNYPDEWNDDWKYCPYCGQKAEEVKE